MTRNKLITTTLFLSLCAACTSNTQPTSQVEGAMRYQDAETNADGTPRPAESPPAQRATVTIEVRGSGTLDGLEGAACVLEGTSGQFHALFDGTAAIDDNGAYVAALAAGDGRIETLGGCAIPELTVGIVNDVVVRATLEATTANCTTYCEANARAQAEGECQGSSSQVTCRAAAEADAAAACRTECTTQRDVIVAEATLSGSLLGDLDAESLRAAAFADLAIDLTFDHME